MAEYTIDKIEYGNNVYKLQDNVSGYVTTEVFYGTCATAAATAAKVVACENFSASDLKAGTIIVVYFSLTNSGAVGDLTLNVNGTGAKSIKYINNGTKGNLTSAGYLKASTSYPFLYDGTNWLVLINYNSTYSEISAANITNDSGSTTGLVTGRRAKAAVEAFESVTDVTVNGTSVVANRVAAITIPTNSGTITEVKTTAGTHSTIDVTSGVASFNVPTKTSHLTNDSGFITSAGVTSITTTAGAHTAITSATGAVSFKVPTKTSHLTNDSGFITSYVDEKIKLTSQSTSGTYPLIFGPTSITSNSTYQGYYNTGITVNPSTKTVTATTFVGALTGTASGNLTSSSTLDATKLSGTIPSGCYTNTTYGISGSLSNHAFTSTLTAGGSGTTSVLTLAAGTGITLTDDTTNKKITIACSVTNTDKRLEVSEATSGIFYYPILSTGTTVAETRSQDTTGFSYIGTTGSGSTSGTATFTIGNNIAGSSGKCGYLDIYGIGQYKATLRLGSALTANRLINLPNKDGTIALTSDVVPKPSDEGNFGWVLKYSTNSASFWDPPSGFRFFIKEDSENPGTYSFDGNLPENIQEAWTYGTSLVLELGVLNASDTYDTYTLTDYYAQEVPTEDGCYYVLWFTDVFKTADARQKQITVGIYLDDLEVEHTYGEITVIIDTVVSAGTDGSEGMTIGGWKICWGSVSLTTASASGNGTYASPYYTNSSKISLNYTALPYVWCQVQGEWTGTRYATPYDVSETGFKIRLYASAKNSTTTSIRWFSIGKA